MHAVKPNRLRRNVVTTVVLAALGGGVVATSAVAQEQAYPSRPIRLIVPFTAGGVTDTSGRLVAERLAQRLKQTIIVDNRPGASGNIGTMQAATASPDGYTLLLAFDGTMVINPHVFKKMPFDTLKDFKPVGKIGDAVLLLVSHPGVQAKNWADLLKLSKTDPSGLSYGTSGIASTPHIAGEQLRLRTGANLVHVPYKGGGQALADLVGGNVPLVFTTVASSHQQVRSGKAHPIAVASAKRVASLPDVPTFMEAGLPDFKIDSWVGIMAPAKTPQAIIDKLNTELNAVLNDPETRDRLIALGITPAPGTPAKYGEDIKQDLERYSDVVKKAKIDLE